MTDAPASTALLAFGSAVPPYGTPQAELAEWMVTALQASPALARWLQRVYAGSGIETRYSCLPDAAFPALESAYAPGRPLNELATTAERMAVYEREALLVAEQAAQRALDDFAQSQELPPQQAAAAVTHLLVVSCTGFFAPGLDQLLARRLGLPAGVERTLIGFMGCAAAFNALRSARQIIGSRPDAVVLLVCVELCTIHIQPGTEREHLIAGAIFADGAAACVLGAAEQARGDHYLLADFYTALKPDAAGDMVWRIGNHGFNLRLSPQIPNHLGDVAPAALQHLFGGARPDFWAIHPGGRGIVDRLAEIFDLSAQQTMPSLHILRNFGNLSSPTILFVLQEQRRQLRAAGVSAPRDGIAMAFGPGLVTEMARLSYVPAAEFQPETQEAVCGLLA